VAFVRTGVSEERIASIIRVKSSLLILFTLLMEVIRYSELWALKRATRRQIPRKVIASWKCIGFKATVDQET
jgi:hypothetical protein